MKTVEALYCFTARDERGREGVLQSRMGPLISRSMQHAREIEPLAQAAADRDGVEVRLVVFRRRKVLNVLVPRLKAIGLKGG